MGSRIESESADMPVGSRLVIAFAVFICTILSLSGLAALTPAFGAFLAS